MIPSLAPPIDRTRIAAAPSTVTPTSMFLFLPMYSPSSMSVHVPWLVIDEAEVPFMESHSTGLFEVGVSRVVDKDGGKQGLLETP